MEARPHRFRQPPRATAGLPTPRRLAIRWLSLIYTAGPLLALVWFALHPEPLASTPLFLASIAAALVTAATVRTGVLNLSRPRVLQLVLTCGTAGISLCIGAAGGGGLGLGLLYLWTTPLAFALSSRPAAYAQVAWTGALYAVALAVQDRAGGAFPSSLDVIRLLFTISTTILVGELVRALSRSLEASSRLMSEAFASSPVAMALRQDSRILAANDAFGRLVGRSPREVVGRDVPELTRPQDTGDRDRRYVQDDGRVVWARVRATDVRPDPQAPPLSFTQAVDVTAEHEADVARERTRRLDLALGALSRRAVAHPRPEDVMADAARVLATELDATHVMVTELLPGAERLRFVAGAGWPDDDPGRIEIPVAGSHAGQALAADRHVVLPDITPATAPASAPLHREGIRSGVASVIRRPGTPWGVLGVHATRRDAFDAEAAAYVDQVAEVLSSAVQRAEAERQAREAALHDRLTGLPGRELVLQRLAAALEAALEAGRRLGVLLLDLDELRLVNEGYGHEVGDEVVRVVAARLAARAGDGACAGHLAGDELVLICQANSDERLFAVADELLATVRRPIPVGDEQLVVTTSIGVAVGGSEPRSPEALLREADVALERAKQQGRARFEVYDDLTHRQALERLRLQVDLRAALDHEELRLVFQPLVSLADGQVSGAEALLRWHHLTRGVVPPADFIPVAESSGLIVPIGLQVLRAACGQAAAWAAAGTPIPVSVNVAVQQLARRGFAGEVQGALDATGLPPSLLALELTETTLMEAGDRVLLDELRAVRALGVAVHLDDFGTGYSSLGSLRDVPLDVLKVDRSFVSSLGVDPHSEPILRAITTMAHELGLRVVAEGVESADQRDLVTELGCDEAQGYLFAAPSAPEMLAELLAGPVPAAALRA